MANIRHEQLVEPLSWLIQHITGENSVNLISITQEDPPAQGESGAEVSMYTIGYTTTSADVIHTLQAVVKQSPLRERRIVNMLMEQGQAVPPTYIPDLESDSQKPIFMQYAQPRPAHDMTGTVFNPTTSLIAEHLAKLHAANRTRCPHWLPRVSDDVMNNLYLNETLTVWERCLTDNDFYAEFGQYDQHLKLALEQFLRLNQQLTDEGDTLTLINSDLHPDHIRLLRDDQPVFIDWEQSYYGSFYIDLVNYFSIETALLYRDALADTGYVIPAADFMERFREVGHWMGLRYLEVGLLAWEAGGEQWQQGRWFFHYCLTMALRGR